MARFYWFQFVQRFRWDHLKDSLRVPQGQTFAEGTSSQWSNQDLAPTPPKERKWNFWTFTAFWTAHASDATAWTAGSATVALGLTWWQAWLALNVAHMIGSILIVANGRMASRYHVGFPVCARVSWGMWGSYMAVAMRAVICIIWNGVNTFYAGRLVDVCLQCIWPSWALVANTLPDSAGITTRELTGFLIAWFICEPFTLWTNKRLSIYSVQCLTFVHPRDLKWFYVAKSVIVLAAMHGILAWWMRKNGGVHFPSQNGNQLSGSTRAWLWMQAFNSGFGAVSSLTVNQADIARYAKSPNDQLWGQIFVFPLASALPGLFGVLVASASQEMYGTPLWNLWDVTQKMLNQYPHDSGARFGIFLAAASMALALIGVNLATNCLPFGSDVSALFPKYMNIQRGQFLCCLLGLAIAPWKILSNGTTFLAFLAGYGYWLAPVAAILFIDYFFVQNGNIVTDELYNGKPGGLYWYSKGWNIRAPIVTVLALVPCLPGFAWTISDNVKISLNAARLSTLSFILTYAIAALMYWASYQLWPRTITAQTNEQFEFLAEMVDEEETSNELGDIDKPLSDKSSIRECPSV
ncbi:permease for cytosine/purines, uracil, thiamine, allantoin-domain-containing protein [Lentinula aciculospora]|uniref:Permease for cytosine/purines, uracil, thiamine, allantoin-domain-containing protein n=1 Tax=Lentinula aciculospora TaxID=153920 RepID=A0A9W9DP54_9AGAR|nr:permease for cytosine/purines, uracil, thiamine, allantoin-domain-containing protein [Lentinula aciculospora]